MENKLLEWYKENKRILPWRNNQDPYRIWISEIMLQQTRVETVIPYFERFLKQFPTLEVLASASEDELYKVWQGLGYYSRVRNMQIASKEILEKFNGQFPTTYQELLQLKGIGNYTSRAISSIAFGEHVGAIDGNAYRIITRLYCINDNIQEPSTNQKIQNIVDQLVENVPAGDFNQAIMDLGSSICLPKNPHCEKCPIQEFCESYKTNSYELYPVNIKKVKIKKQKFIVGIICNHDSYYLIKNNKGLLKNLYGNIQYETNHIENFIQSVQEDHSITIYDGIYLGHVNHIFTHRIWDLDVYLFKTLHTGENMYNNLEELPISTCHQKVLQLKKEYPL